MNVLVAIPIRPTQHPALKAACFQRALALTDANPGCHFQFVFDLRPVDGKPTDCRPWSKVARARNRIVKECALDSFDYVLWIDSDVIDYPPDMPTRLIAANPGGMTAPIPLVEGFDRRFYDWSAFIRKGTCHIRPTEWINLPGRNVGHVGWEECFPDPVTEMDVVGTITMVPAIVYKTVEYEDHAAYTDHFPICNGVRALGQKVCAVRDVIVTHANLPLYGEQWH